MPVTLLLLCDHFVSRYLKWKGVVTFSLMKSIFLLLYLALFLPTFCLQFHLLEKCIFFTAFYQGQSRWGRLLFLSPHRPIRFNLSSFIDTKHRSLKTLKFHCARDDASRWRWNESLTGIRHFSMFLKMGMETIWWWQNTPPQKVPKKVVVRNMWRTKFPKFYQDRSVGKKASLSKNKFGTKSCLHPLFCAQKFIFL